MGTQLTSLVTLCLDDFENSLTIPLTYLYLLMVHPDRLLAPAPTHKPAVLEAVVLRKRLDNVLAVVARDGAFTLVTEKLGRI